MGVLTADERRRILVQSCKPSSYQLPMSQRPYSQHASKRLGKKKKASHSGFVHRVEESKMELFMSAEKHK